MVLRGRWIAAGLLLLATSSSCSRVDRLANKVTEKAAENTADLAQSAGKGFSQGFTDIELEVLASFPASSLTMGHAKKAVNQPTVSVYLIAASDFQGPLQLRLLTPDNVEVGRSNLQVDLLQNEARFFDFEFDERTPFSQGERYVLSGLEAIDIQ